MEENRFLWGDVQDRRKYHLVTWNELKKPLPFGNLGLRSLVERNKVLQCKWLLRFMSEEGAY